MDLAAQYTHLRDRMLREYESTGRRAWRKEVIESWYPHLPADQIREILDYAMYQDGVFLNGLSYQVVIK